MDRPRGVDPAGRDTGRFLVLALVSLVGWVLGSALGSLTANAADGLAAVYLPIGIAVALMLRNPGYWWAVALGAIVGGLAIALATGGDPNASLVGSSINAAEAALVAVLLRRRRAEGFAVASHALWLLAVGLVGAGVGAVAGATAMVRLTGTPWIETFPSWFAADLVAIILLVPMLTLVRVRGTSRARWIRLALLLVGAGALSLAAVEAALLAGPFVVFLAWYVLLLAIVIVGVRWGVVAMGIAQLPAAVAAFAVVRDAPPDEWLLRQGFAVVLGASLLWTVLAVRGELSLRLRSERLARDMFEQSPVATARVLLPPPDAQGPLAVVDANAAWQAMFGTGVDHDLLRAIDPSEAAGLVARLTAAEEVEVRISTKGAGGLRIARMAGVSMGPGDADQRPSLVIVADDITAQREAERLLRMQATTDPLTGLLNRAAFTDLLAERLAGTEPVGTALVFIDLDGFKAVNDTFGHRVGDRVLCAVADRMVALVRPRDVAARLAGDEFVLLVEVEDPDALPALVERLTARLREPLRVDGIEVTCGASMGVAHAEPGDTPSSLIERADLLMYRSKRARRRMLAED